MQNCHEGLGSLEMSWSLPEKLHHPQHEEEVWREVVHRGLFQKVVWSEGINPAVKRENHEP